MIEINISDKSNQHIANTIVRWKELGLKVTIIGKEEQMHVFLANILNTFYNKTVTYYAERFEVVLNHQFFEDWTDIIVMSEDDDDCEGYNLFEDSKNIVFLMESLYDIVHLTDRLVDRNVLVSIKI